RATATRQMIRQLSFSFETNCRLICNTRQAADFLNPATGALRAPVNVHRLPQSPPWGTACLLVSVEFAGGRSTAGHLPSRHLPSDLAGCQA
ncbi:MAG: hypothetical protein KDM81_23400, partial [Verrucomicrobiae bacterium]|nr:hypothetical protein [Verrucomicrobiae bacterium]